MLAFNVEDCVDVMNLSDEVWLLDSGASLHMTFKKTFFCIWKSIIVKITQL